MGETWIKCKNYEISVDKNRTGVKISLRSRRLDGKVILKLILTKLEDVN
jgi:hypothetical protein